MSVKRKEQTAGANSRSVLIVDDEEDILELIELTLLRMGLDVDRATTVKMAIEKVQSGDYDLCLTDMRLPDGEGLELVQFISDNLSDLPVAVITAHGNTENAVAALKAGAFDYLAKPVSLEQLRTLVKSALSLPQPAVSKTSSEQSLLGESAAIQQVRHLIQKLARSEAPRSEEHTSELQSPDHLVCRLLLEKKK